MHFDGAYIRLVKIKQAKSPFYAAMPEKKGASGVDNTHRKTWDRADFHQKAKDRAIRVSRTR